MRVVFLAQQSDVVAQRDSRLNSALRVVEPPKHHIGVDQPEAARQEHAFAGRQAVVDARVVARTNPSTISRRSIASIVPITRGPPAAGSRPREAAAGSRRALAAIGLHEAVLLRIEALAAHIGMDIAAQLRQRSSGTVESYSSALLMARSKATQAITLE
jgi:hypothetical protein